MLELWRKSPKKYCPQCKHSGLRLYNVQEAGTVNDTAQSTPRIYVAVDNHQANHQAAIIEMEGMLHHQNISIFTDPSSKFIYISPAIGEKCALKREAHEEQKEGFSIG